MGLPNVPIWVWEVHTSGFVMYNARMQQPHRVKACNQEREQIMERLLQHERETGKRARTVMTSKGCLLVKWR